MASSGVTLMCYWNGKMLNGPNGISYEGATPKPIRVSYGISHNELLEKMYKITGFDKQQNKLKITCRYPACKEYISVLIDDDESVDIMFDAARQPGTNCMELYLEKVPIPTDDPVNVTMPVQNSHSENQLNMKTEKATCDAHAGKFLHPGPIDNTVLNLQDQHRSEAVWAGEDPGVLTCRQRLGTMMREWHLDHRIRRYVIESGFYGVYRVGFIQLDWPLITALVERWRQETHTFHFPVGESTVTLQDVSVLLGLRIHGHVVSGSCDLQWDDLCEELLGLRPDRAYLHGSALKLSWLRAHFQQPPPDADDSTLQRYSRAYILALIGGVLFTDKSGSDVQLMFLPLLRDLTHAGQLSWGSAALAHLYRELCRASRKGANEIAGPLILLQLWAWERLHIGRPDRLRALLPEPVVPDGEDLGNQELLPSDPLGCRWRFPHIRRDNPQRALIFYRDQLDQQRDDQVTWQPYTPELLGSLPDVCVNNQHIWRTVAPLVCFDIVEWHRPDRVLRQFGLHQGIPKHCDTEMALHAIDKRGRHHYDWQDYHGPYIKLWEAREETVVTSGPEERPMHYHDPYMEWYRSITRLYITPPNQRPHMRFQPSSGNTHVLLQCLMTIHRRCIATLDAFTSDCARNELENIQAMSARALEMIGETRHLEKGPATPLSFKPQTDNIVDLEEPSQLNHIEVTPAAPNATTSSIQGSVMGRGRGRGRERRRSLQALSATSPMLQASMDGDDDDTKELASPVSPTLAMSTSQEHVTSSMTSPESPQVNSNVLVPTQKESSRAVGPKKKRSKLI